MVETFLPTQLRSHHVKYLYWNMPYKMYLFHMIKLILQLFMLVKLLGTKNWIILELKEKKFQWKSKRKNILWDKHDTT